MGSPFRKLMSKTSARKNNHHSSLADDFAHVKLSGAGDSRYFRSIATNRRIETFWRPAKNGYSGSFISAPPRIVAGEFDEGLRHLGHASAIPVYG
jgi:hypothetical protein